ncbi:MAG: tail fiber domain-containing protein [Clostridia bacterium]|nr:tail fiber domain-containing protein [Clostridia bacterium]
MQAQAQFTIHSLNDVIASTTAPSSPYKGQLWVDTSYSPPRTFVYNGSAWKEQNGTDTLRSNISTLTTKSNTMRSDLDGLTSTVSAVTTRVETVEDDLGVIEETVLDMESTVSTLEQTASSISLQVTQNKTNITSLTADVTGLKTRVSNAEGSISTLQQTATTLSASVASKLSATGGDSSSFGWSLTSSGFYLYANDNTVMEVNESSMYFYGDVYATGGELSYLTVTGRLYFGGNDQYYIDPNYDDGSYYIYLPGFRVDDASGAVFSGRLSAPSGSIGGFTIATSKIYKTKTSYSSTTAGVYIGTDGIGLGAGTFYVTSAGALTCTSGTIGGFTIGASSMYKTKTAYSNTTAGVYVGTDGIGLGAGTFYVTSAGALTATSATITGTVNATGGTFQNVTITGSIYFNEDQDYYINPNYNNGSWYIYLPKFRVDDTSAYFSGTLQAPGGTIGGFTISTSAIYKTKTSYSSSTAGVYIGTDGIGLGAGTFYVTSAGAVTASNVKITGGSIALGSANNQNYLSMTSSRILFGISNSLYTQINWSGITIGMDQWGLGTCNRLNLGAFGGGDTGISSFGVHAYLDPDGDNIFTISAEDTDYSYMGSGYIEMRIGTTYAKCYGYLGSTWKSSSSITVSSDRNIKNSIADMPTAYSAVFDKLRPVIFKYNKGTGGRFHTGFIAQEVADAVTSSGLTLEDFAAVCAPYADDDVWGIRYEEIISLNTWEIQKLKAEIAALKKLISTTTKQSKKEKKQ